MKFPQFWARVSNDSGKVHARGWSEDSQEKAHQDAANRLQRILTHLRNNDEPEHYSLYNNGGYICEEVIERLHLDEQEVGIVSRNAYGCRVLNSEQVLFIDIDFPRKGCFFSLFSSRKSPEEKILKRVEKWHQENDHYSLRLYQTFAGCRLIIMNRLFNDRMKEAVQLMQELGADPLYIRLCQQQQCFRARLEPKYWRLGLKDAPPGRFPRNAEAAEAMRGWLATFETASRGHSTCHLLEEFGAIPALPEAQFLADWHEMQTRAGEELTLA